MAYRRGRYWYRSVRVGRRVIKEYLGTGELAQTMAEIDALEQQERDLARRAIRAEMDQEREIDRLLDAVGVQVRALTGAVLEAHGYHKHKGQWRKQRNVQRDGQN